MQIIPISLLCTRQGKKERERTGTHNGPVVVLARSKSKRAFVFGVQGPRMTRLGKEGRKGSLSLRCISRNAIHVHQPPSRGFDSFLQRRRSSSLPPGRSQC